MSKSGVIGVAGKGVACALRYVGGADTRGGTLSSVLLVGSVSESTAGRFCFKRVLFLASFESAVRVVRELIADQ